MELRSIKTGITSIRFLSATLEAFLFSEFKFDQETVKETLSPYIKALKSNLYVLIEYPYVDKVFRDSFYTYYSSKHTRYERDCIRLSFFSKKITDKDFYVAKRIDKLKEIFLGFIVLRPILPKLVGRTMLSPRAFKQKKFSCCIVKTNSSINGIKLDVRGFPHSSQDSETITCAETTLWGVMEYFSHRYAEYKPILPSTIINVLSSSAYERQKPSIGLQPSQISFALKEFGFGVKIYSAENYGEEFNRILYYYLQSGIPVIAALTYDSNDEQSKPRTKGEKRIVIGHAVTYVGLGEFRANTVNGTKIAAVLDNGIMNLEIVDSADFSRDLVAIDDNFPPYQKASVNKPTKYYPHENWKKCKISSIIVPLYHKIYLEAVLAKQYVFRTLTSRTFGYLSDEPIVLNFFLTSSRSYKYEMMRSDSLAPLHKQLLMYTSMPKFIWVAELSTKRLFVQDKGIGFILIDATATNQNIEDLLIFIAYPTATYAYHDNDFKKIVVNLKPFGLYHNNLTKF